MNGKAFGGGIVAATVLGAVLLTGCSSSPTTQSSGTTASTTAASTTSSTSSSSAGSAAPCTHSAIAAAATSDSSLGQVNSVDNFGCSGTWAYANVSVGSGSGAFDAVIVLQAQGSTWSVADRGNACNNHLVPSNIYTQACTTS